MSGQHLGEGRGEGERRGELCVCRCMYTKLSNGSLLVMMIPNTGAPASSGRRWCYSEHEKVVGENHEPPFHATRQVLDDFQDQFIADMDAIRLFYGNFCARTLSHVVIRRGSQGLTRLNSK